MAKKRRIKVGRLILAIIIVLLVAALLIFGVKFIFSKFNEPEKEVNNQQTIDEVLPNEETEVEEENNQEPDASEGLKIDLVDYECYPNMEMDFDFIIARVRFKDSKAINYDLSKMVTNEGIKLSEGSYYINELLKKNYYVSKKNVVTEVRSDETSYIATLFIPYKTDDVLVSVTCDNNDKLEFNVSNNYHDLSELYYEGGTTIQDDNYDIFISDASISYALFENKNFVDIPSSQKVYTFTLDVNDIKDGLTLKEAKYVSNGQEYKALGKEYTSEIAKASMFDGTLSKGKQYGLMFVVMSQDTDKIVYDGELWLKFSSKDEWVKIQARFD